MKNLKSPPLSNAMYLRNEYTHTHTHTHTNKLYIYNLNLFEYFNYYE